MPGPHLLVSVRDATEALAALDGGADLIDVKEPNSGPLGRADAETIAAVVQAVAGRVPVSAALGELMESQPTGVPEGLAFVKWGLRGLGGSRWQDRLPRKSWDSIPSASVPVAYADWVGPQAPPPSEVVNVAVKAEMPAVLFDTFLKDESTLLDWLSVEEIAALVRTCHAAGVKVALAGSLTAAQIERLRDVRPDWFAVRGAVCEGGRGGAVSGQNVRALADFVHTL